MIDMARKDNKGRNLKTGEYQRPDGRYEYRYKDEITGKRNSVYAADLASLREMEKKINKDMDDLLITDASVKKLTVNTLFERYMATKNIKERTKKNYIRMWDYRIRNTLGNIRVLDFKTSHVRTFFSALSDEGLAHSTIKGLYGLLNPSFELAVEDGIIRKNPVTGTLGDYGAPAKEKEALTLEQQEKLLKYVEQSNVYKPHLPMMQVMFGACLRVSDDDDKIRLNQRKPSKYKGLRRFGPEKNLQRINKFMKERPIFYKNLIQMKENIRFYLRCFYCITKVMILQFNSENRTELARNG